MTRSHAPGPTPQNLDPAQRIWSFRWKDGPEEVACGRNAAVAALALGYGFDDFKNLTWEERG
jgi:hypothetical protein